MLLVVRTCNSSKCSLVTTVYLQLINLLFILDKGKIKKIIYVKSVSAGFAGVNMPTLVCVCDFIVHDI